RIVVRDAAADRATIADRRMRDIGRRFRQQRPTGADLRIAQQVRMTHQRAEGQTSVSRLDAVEFFDAIDVDQHGRADDTAVEHRHQALPARQHAAVAAGIREDVHRFVHAARRVIVEPCRLHEYFDPFLSPLPPPGTWRASRPARTGGPYNSSLLYKTFTILSPAARWC